LGSINAISLFGYDPSLIDLSFVLIVMLCNSRPKNPKYKLMSSKLRYKNDDFVLTQTRTI